MAGIRRIGEQLAWCAFVTVLVGCGGGDPVASVTKPLDAGTFRRIQEEIFDQSCVSCHRSGTSDARQSKLVLTSDSSYEQLIDVKSANQIANADDMRRVRPMHSDSSLLYHKVNWIPGHHSRDYGQLMPMGTTHGLTNGQLEYLRQWIDAGAPRAGNVVDAEVLKDTREQSVSFTPLSPPTEGTGIQLTVDSFAVVPSMERELFLYRLIGNTSDIYVTRIQTRMRPGSHHLLLYTFDDSKTSFPCNTRPAPNLVRDIRNPDGSMNFLNMLPMACHVFFAGSMTPEGDYRFPAGVALRLPANAAIDMNVHYVNRAPINLAGQAFANLYTTDRSQVQIVAGTLNLPNTGFSLPAHQRTTIRTVFPMSSQKTVLALTSHMHSLGERYEIMVRRANGTETSVYVNTDWEHPAFVNFQTPIVLQAGDALVSVVTYNNVTDHTVGFGLLSTDEMNIIFGYWY